MFNFLVLLYELGCLIYAGLSVWKKRQNGLIIAIMITFLPVIGLVLALYLFKSSGFRRQLEARGPDFLLAQGEQAVRIQLRQPVEIEKEMNLVPIQDALLLNDNKTKRKLLIHSLKENTIQNPIVLEKALENEDSETSHYAATAIMEIKRKLLNRIQLLEEELKKKPDDAHVLSTYAGVICEYLHKGFLDAGTYHEYQILLSAVLERILTGGHGSKQHYIDKINTDLELHEYKKANFYCERFMEDYSDDEMAYLLAMKLHYTLKNSSRLQEVISLLKKQSVRLSPQGLSMIRFWL